MTAIFSRVRFNERQAIAMVVFVLISSAGQMIAPSLPSMMIDRVSSSDQTAIIYLAIAMIVVSLLACITNVIANSLAGSLTTKLAADLRNEVFRKVQTFSATEIDKSGTASLISRNTSDVTVIQTFFAMLFRAGLLTPMMAVIGLVFAIATTGQLALVIAIAVPIVVVVIALVRYKSSQYSVKLRSMTDGINQLFLETLEGVRVIRAFNRQEYEINRFGKVNEETAEVSRKSIAISGMMTPVVNSLFGLTSVGAMLFGSFLVTQNELDVSALVAAIQYINMILIAIMLFATVISLFPDAYACMRRIGEVLETEVTIKGSDKETCKKTCRGTVEFRTVTFAYPGADAPVIKGIDFVSKPGELTAIIGRTGCGKSRSVHFLSCDAGRRSRDAPHGQRMADVGSHSDDSGHAARLWAGNEAWRSELRKHFGMVLQDTWLFEGTIRDNLKYSTTREVSDEEMEKAAKSVCADTFIHTMPGGYDMVLSKGAENISQGQRQLLTIARAIIADPEIMILDEATSNVDAHTEQAIQNAMAVLLKGRTSFVIAHRLSTIRDVDVILYMEDGDIKEVGDHETLMKLGGKYTALYNSQFG